MGWTRMGSGFWGYASAMGVLVQAIKIRRLGFMVGDGLDTDFYLCTFIAFASTRAQDWGGGPCNGMR